jgi:hypothetical protein
MFDVMPFKAFIICELHFAAFRLRTCGLSITVAVWHGLKIQAFAVCYFWEMACRETVLIGNLPTRLLPLSRHAFRPDVRCLPSADRGTSLRGITAERGREGLSKKNQALNVSYALDSYHTRQPGTSLTMMPLTRPEDVSEVLVCYALRVYESPSTLHPNRVTS